MRYKTKAWYSIDGILGFRLFGYQVSIINREKHKPLADERKDQIINARIGKYNIKLVKMLHT